MRYHVIQLTETGREKADKRAPLNEDDVELFGKASTFVEAVRLREGIPAELRFANNIIDTCPNEPMVCGYE